jgi:hypothetical protein
MASRVPIATPLLNDGRIESYKIRLLFPVAAQLLQMYAVTQSKQRHQ